MIPSRRAVLCGLGALPASACATLERPAAPLRTRTWTFDNLKSIDGEPTQVEGRPRLIDSPLGRATLFDGVQDAIFVDRHPLAGATTFAFEAYFRPDGGANEQRWFYLGEPISPAYDADIQSAPRFTFEIRVISDEWYLDAFVLCPGTYKGLIFPEKRFPTGRWYHVAQTFDGQTYRSFVNGQLQGETPLVYTPQKAGRSAIGTRINRKSYFNGAVHSARFTPHYRLPSQFLPPISL